MVAITTIMAFTSFFLQLTKIPTGSMQPTLFGITDDSILEMHRLEKVANDNLRPYPAASIRKNVKEIMVALTTIMPFTAFFLRLTKIPTGSMQPTLFGITDDSI